jgi:hypothetical protein
MAAAGLNAAHGGPMAPACARVPGPASMSASTPRAGGTICYPAGGAPAIRVVVGTQGGCAASALRTGRHEGGGRTVPRHRPRLRFLEIYPSRSGSS